MWDNTFLSHINIHFSVQYCCTFCAICILTDPMSLPKYCAQDSKKYDTKHNYTLYNNNARYKSSFCFTGDITLLFAVLKIAKDGN